MLVLRQLRIHQGLSQDALAAAVGVTGPCIHYWETEQSTPHPSNALKLRKVLGCAHLTIDKLLSPVTENAPGQTTGGAIGSPLPPKQYERGEDF